MDTCTVCIRTWMFAFSFSVVQRGLLASSQSSTTCVGPDFLASCAIGDGRDGVETITGRALPEEAREGTYHIKNIKFTRSNKPCLNYSAGCSYGGPTADTAQSVGCVVDEAGTWEECEVIYCSDLPLCDPELQAIVDDTTMPRQVQVYTAQEYVNALMNNRVEEITVMERIYVSEAVLPPVPIIIRRYLLIKPAANAIFVVSNFTMWSQTIVTRLGFFKCMTCAIVVYGADWGASLNISHPYTPLPHVAFERGGVLNMDGTQLLTDCFALDQAGQILIPWLSMHEEPFTRVEGQDFQGRPPLTQLGPPVQPEGRDPLDPPLGVLHYWIAADLIVNVGGGLLQSRAPRISCFEWWQKELWTEAHRSSPPRPSPPISRALNPTDASNGYISNKNNNEVWWAVWVGVGAGALMVVACTWAVATRRASTSASRTMGSDCALLLENTQAMLSIYESLLAVNPTSEGVNPSWPVEEGDLALRWSQMGELLRSSQPVTSVDADLHEESTSVAPTSAMDSENSVSEPRSGTNVQDVVLAVNTATGPAGGEDAEPGKQVSSEGSSSSRKIVLGPLKLSPAQLLVVQSSLHSYQVHEPVGSGAFAVCYRATMVETKRPVVLKMAKFTKHNDDFKLEAELLGSLHYPHLVTLIESFGYQNRQVLVLEWCSGGDMKTSASLEAMDEQFVWQIAVQLALAVAYMHAQKMIHRDIKLENVFFAENGDIKLGDFGTARVILDEATTFAGTPHCMAPEVLWNKPYTQKSDVWSMGALLYEIITHIPLVDGRSIESIRKKHVGLEPKQTMTGQDGVELDVDLVQLVSSMLATDPKDRPSAEEIVSLPCMRREVQKLIEKKKEVLNRCLAELGHNKNTCFDV